MAEKKNVVILDGEEIVLQPEEIISDETIQELTGGKGDDE